MGRRLAVDGAMNRPVCIEVMMRKITAHTLSGGKREYIVPSPAEARAHLKETHGVSYDEVERRRVEGGLPLVWDRVQ